MQHSVFLTCNFLQKVLAKNNFESIWEYDDIRDVWQGRIMSLENHASHYEMRI